MFKLGFIGVFNFGGVASLAPSGRGLPRSGWRSPAARRIKARKIAIFLGHAEITSSKIASSRGLPQSPSAPAPSRREPYNSASNSPINPNLKSSNQPISSKRNTSISDTDPKTPQIAHTTPHPTDFFCQIYSKTKKIAKTLDNFIFWGYNI